MVDKFTGTGYTTTALNLDYNRDGESNPISTPYSFATINNPVRQKINDIIDWLNNIISGVTSFTKAVIDNITIDGNTISSTNTNGDITLTPNGTGKVVFSSGTATTVPYLDANKKLVSSSVTPTTLGYLDATSSVQTQLNGTVKTSGDQTITGIKTFSGSMFSANLRVPMRYYEIGAIKDIVGANLILALIMNETGATTTIRDRSGNGYDATLSANASSMSPLVQGFKNSLLFSATSLYYWEVNDNDAFSFVSGGVDTPFSIFSVISPTSATTGEIFGKINYPGNDEYVIQFESATNKFRLLRYDSAHSSAYLYRYNNTALSLNNIYSVGVTSAAGSTASDIHCYLNGVLDDGTSGSNGSYTCMVNGTAKPGNTATWSGTRYPFVGRQSTIIVANSVLTANQMADLDLVCRGLTTSL